MSPGERASSGPPLERFAKRIERLLRQKPLQLDVEEHRESVGRILESLGELNYFELLGLGPGARPEEVHAAYLEVGRLVHPSHAEKLEIAGGRGALEIVFERVTEAYRTISDPDRCRKYLEKNPEAAWTAVHPKGEEREEEARREARRQFVAARRFAVDGRFHDAIETLEQVLLLDERSEYLALLAQCEAHNPNWRSRALANYQRAIVLDQGNAAYRVELALLFEAAGQRSRAAALVERALQLEPKNEPALTLRDRLQGGSVSGDQPSLWARLFGPRQEGGDR